LILLIEADLLDEEGALRMIWYTLDKGISGAKSYEDVYQHIVMGNNKRLFNHMVTEKAKYYWNESRNLLRYSRSSWRMILLLICSVKIR
jgi:uncharacterized protein